MASEYLLKQAKAQSSQPERELTPKEKWKNWWDYHKHHVLIGLAVAALIGYAVWDSVANRMPEPDYQMAYVGEIGLPDDTVEALESGLAEKGRDLNGDGQVLVRIEQYVMSPQTESAQTLLGTQARLTGDFSTCRFVCFFLEDPASFQEKYEMLAYPDGRIPEEDAPPSEKLWYAWKDCPVLTDMDLGSANLGGVDQEILVENQQLLSQLFIGRGVFMDGWESENLGDYAALWEAMTAGAKQQG